VTRMRVGGLSGPEFRVSRAVCLLRVGDDAALDPRIPFANKPSGRPTGNASIDSDVM